jgi:hypothetical protein
MENPVADLRPCILCNTTEILIGGKNNTVVLFVPSFYKLSHGMCTCIRLRVYVLTSKVLDSMAQKLCLLDWNILPHPSSYGILLLRCNVFLGVNFCDLRRK